MHKLAFVKGYLLAKGLYKSATWPELSKGDDARIHKAVMRPLRAIVDGPRADHKCTPDREVLNALGLPAPTIMIAVCRLSLLKPEP